MSLVETLPDDQYLAWWRKRRAEILRPVVKAITRRSLRSSTFHEAHTVPTFTEWRKANSQTFPWVHTVPTYEQYMTGFIGGGSVTLKRILADVSSRHDVTVEQLLSKERQRHVCRARHEAMWIAHMSTSMSLSALAAKFGGRDHTSISHGIVAHADRHGLPAKREPLP